MYYVQKLQLMNFSYCDTNGSRGCLGCCGRPTAIVDVPTKGLGNQRRVVRKPNISDGIWSTSTGDMENSAIQSQRSISSMNTSKGVDSLSGASSTSSPPEFVNHGLFLWNQSRQNWLGNKKSVNRALQDREPRLSWNATYDNLLGTNKSFSQSITLTEMVDFLVDIWEQEGMYD
ncbi:hypothetical protein GIB67_017806 [Kingdonia uniflora]|uniref:Gag1-like clamp domain-containing protein n=1 Tax=Kingdonia uniflora TaxID=39325 RepID=A0A7J7MPF4_9MAGN|nr:hypothetical protein GIB67_017806 [Kingdonia uniflora]